LQSGWKTRSEVKLSLRLPQFEKIREVLRSRGNGAARRGVPRREVLIIAAAGVASAVITLIVLTVSFNARERRAAELTKAAPVGAQAASQAPDKLSIDDFILPTVPPADSLPDYYPFRPRFHRWSRENVERFWVSPRQIAIDTIATINDRNMESVFEKVR